MKAIIPAGSATARAGRPIARRPKTASTRKPTASVPKVMHHATAWDTGTITCALAPRPCAAGQATTARSTARSPAAVGRLTAPARRHRILRPGGQEVLSHSSHFRRRPSMGGVSPLEALQIQDPPKRQSPGRCTNRRAGKLPGSALPSHLPRWSPQVGDVGVAGMPG